MLLVFDSHPVQYRVPIWREMERLQPGSVHVVYATDCSVRGHADRGFGQTVAWDDPMLEGYPYTVLSCERGTPLSGWGSLTGEGVRRVLAEKQAKAVLLTGLKYRYDAIACLAARSRGIPLWLRCETQDAAFYRARLKSILRFLVYRGAYKAFDRFFYIGELNRKHYRAHGVAAKRLASARYCTVDRFTGMTDAEKAERRIACRSAADIADDALVVGFSGKLIPKKHPDILFGMLAHLPEELRRRVHLYFLGSGALEPSLCEAAAAAQGQWGVKTHFAGFVNQSGLANHYLAMDILVLPSRRQGETWGLVANEAMQAGCGVIVSDAVGCHADFQSWERFRVFPTGDAPRLAQAVTDLAAFPRSFSWARERLQADYSIEATAKAFLENLKC